MSYESVCILNEQQSKILKKVGINIYMYSPIQHNDVFINFKGYIYNITDLCKYNDIVFESVENSIIELYLKFGLEYTLQILDGVFSFILFDYNFQSEFSKLYVVSDVCSILPIYKSFSHQLQKHNQAIKFEFFRQESPDNIICENGTYSLFVLPTEVNPEWIPSIIEKKYFIIPHTNINHTCLINNYYSCSIEDDTVDKWRNLFKEYLRGVIQKICSKLVCVCNKETSEHIGDKLIYESYCYFYTSNDIKPTVGKQLNSQGFLLLFPHNNQINELEYDYLVRSNIENFNKKVKPLPENIYIFMDKQLIQFIMMIPLHIRRIMY